MERRVEVFAKPSSDNIVVDPKTLTVFPLACTPITLNPPSNSSTSLTSLFSTTFIPSIAPTTLPVSLVSSSSSSHRSSMYPLAANPIRTPLHILGSNGSKIAEVGERICIFWFRLIEKRARVTDSVLGDAEGVGLPKREPSLDLVGVRVARMERVREAVPRGTSLIR